ncbi:hypothetical protein B0H67DRAFT_560235, partial [Lasiosphaeris hirsuta]
MASIPATPASCRPSTLRRAVTPRGVFVCQLPRSSATRYCPASPPAAHRSRCCNVLRCAALLFSWRPTGVACQPSVQEAVHSGCNVMLPWCQTSASRQRPAGKDMSLSSVSAPISIHTIRGLVYPLGNNFIFCCLCSLPL